MEKKEMESPQDCSTLNHGSIVTYPKIDHNNCTVCEECVSACPQDYLYLGKNKIEINNKNKCDDCGKCVEACPMYAIEIVDN